MATAYLTHPSSLAHEMGPGHPERPERVAAIHRRLRASGVLDALDAVDAPAATEAQLARAHDPAYVAAVRAASPGHGYRALDADTTMNPHTFEAALHAAGAVIEATERVASGRADNAFCNVRPPGHHAERARAMGFCLFDNVAVGILHALDALGLARVALVDFDVHHGNGSEDILAGDERVLMVSTFQTMLYPGSGEIPKGANMRNVGLRPRTGGAELRAAVDGHWLPALRAFEPQMLFVSAGFDAHRDDPLASLGWLDDDYRWLSERLVEVAGEMCGGKIVSTLEGGYDLDALARCAELHVRALAGLS